MNIVLLASPAYEEIGGVSTHVHMLAKGLEASGHRAFIVPVLPPKWFRSLFVTLPALLIQMVSPYLAVRYMQRAKEWYYAKHALRATHGRIDVLNMQSVLNVGIVEQLRRATGCKTVLTVHGYLTYEAESGGWCQPGDRIHQWLSALEKNGYRQFDAIVCVGKRNKDYVESFGIGPVHLVPNGLDTGLYKPSEVSSRTGKKHLTILFAGTLQETKGIMDVLQMVDLLVNGWGIKLELKVAGTGPQEAQARAFARERRLEDCIIFTGALKKEHMVGFYQSGDVFVCPSKAGEARKGEESFPYTTLEAMSCGLPVLAYRTGGLAEQISEGETGFLVDSGDVAALAEWLRLLVENPERLARMGTAARTAAVEKYSHRTMAERFVAVYAQAGKG